VSEPFDEEFNYHVAGTGDSMVTKDEGRLFIAGMINVMLNKDRLRALDKCSFGNDKIAEDVQKI